ncbi:MAG: hypothetical protein AAGH67_08775 [Cyanobacteria bacterium P01_H01_bin.162]
MNRFGYIGLLLFFFTGGIIISNTSFDPLGNFSVNSFLRKKSYVFLKDGTRLRLPEQNSDEILKQSIEIVRDPNSNFSEQDSRHLLHLIAIRLIEAGRVNKAIELISHADNLEVNLYPLSLIDVLSQSRAQGSIYFSEMEDLKREMASELVQEKLLEGEFDNQLSQALNSGEFEYLVTLVDRAIELEEFDLADALTSKIIQLNSSPLDIKQQLNLIKIYIQLGDNEANTPHALIEAVKNEELTLEQNALFAEYLVGFGFVDDALALLEHENFTPGQQLAIAIALAKSGQIEMALGIAEQQSVVLSTTTGYGETFSSGKVSALAMIAVAVAKNGKSDRAREILNEALALVPELPYGYMSNGSCANARAGAYAQIARSFAEIDALEEASEAVAYVSTCFSAVGFPSSVPGERGVLVRDILDDLNTVSEVIRFLPGHWEGTNDLLDTNSAKAEFAIRLAELGDVDKAINVANKTQFVRQHDASWNAVEYVWSHLTTLFLEQGKLDAAVYAARKLQEAPDFSADRLVVLLLLIRVGDDLNKAGDYDAAERTFRAVFLESKQLLIDRFGYGEISRCSAREPRDISLCLEISEDIDKGKLFRSIVARINLSVAFDEADQIDLGAEFLEDLPSDISDLINTYDRWENKFDFPTDIEYINEISQRDEGNVGILLSVGWLDQALEIANRMPPSEQHVKALANISTELYELDILDESQVHDAQD